MNERALEAWVGKYVSVVEAPLDGRRPLLTGSIEASVRMGSSCSPRTHHANPKIYPRIDFSPGARYTTLCSQETKKLRRTKGRGVRKARHNANVGRHPSKKEGAWEYAHQRNPGKSKVRAVP
jgi:hypothetical protein